MSGLIVEPGSNGSVSAGIPDTGRLRRTAASARTAPVYGSSTTMSPPSAPELSTASRKARSAISCHSWLMVSTTSSPGRGGTEAKSGDPSKRAELETLAELLDHLDEGLTLADWEGELPAELDPLTTKPLLAVENGPGGIDCKLEAELAELPEAEAAEFRDGPSALDEVVRRLSEALGLITFFTVGE